MSRLPYYLDGARWGYRLGNQELIDGSMPPVDGGLEILTDDGSWAHRVSRGVHALTIDYVLRMRGPLKDDLVEEFRAATDCEGEPMSILQADAQYGEGFNHWLNHPCAPLALPRSDMVGGARPHREPADPRRLARWSLSWCQRAAMLASERNALMNEIDAAQLAVEAAKLGTPAA